MKKLLLPGLLLLGLISSSFGQSFLLFHKNNHREVKYKVGDNLSFSLKEDKTKITLPIKGFEDGLIVFQYYKVNPKEITRLYLDEKTRTWFILRHKYKKFLPLAGLGYFLLDAINSEKIREETLVISGSLIAAGLVSKLVFKEWIPIKGKRKLVVIEE